QIVGWLEERDAIRRPRYQLVIVDAPASGHSLPLFATAANLSGLGSIGPLREVLRKISGWLQDNERTCAFVVSIPEEWAVSEAVELQTQLRDSLGLRVSRPLLNGVFPRRFSRRDAEILCSAESEASIDPRLLRAARYFLDRRAASAKQARTLR